MQRVIALMTDFGRSDLFVGAMKGVILGINPEAHIVDLAHHIAPQQVDEAAFWLAKSYRFFPSGTVFVAVVDPGVGTDRKILCAHLPKADILAPDNGLLGPLLEDVPPNEIRVVENQDLFHHPVSRTFHGRDIFAPVAAHLSRGIGLEELGPKVDAWDSVKLAKPVVEGDTLKGSILSIDDFGNLLTNITDEDLRDFRDESEVVVDADPAEALPFVETFGNLGDGELGALMGSVGHLEVVCNRGSAEAKLKLRRGDDVIVRRA